MSDTPDYYPPFLQDFHDQKDFVKAFYTWLEMMDNQRAPKPNSIYHSGVTDKLPRRADMCNWMDFSVLLVSMIQFLDIVGYRVYKKKGVDTETEVIIQDLKKLPDAWHSIRYPNAMLSSPESYWRPLMERWKGWWDVMPQDVIEKVRAGE